MIKKIIVSELEGIRAAVAEALTDARAHGLLSEEKIFDIKLSLNELLANSVKYSGSGRSVLVYALKNGSFCCTISDGGCGFEPKKNCCAEVYQESGRGVYLVHSIADELRYNESGNSVYFRIRL